MVSKFWESLYVPPLSTVLYAARISAQRSRSFRPSGAFWPEQAVVELRADRSHLPTFKKEARGKVPKVHLVFQKKLS